MSEWEGWHFLREARTLGYGDGRRVEAGQTYRVEGSLALCERGLHASQRALDALRYAPGPIACRVVLRGERIDGHDKACARERHVLWLADATRVLHEFACWCAEQALLLERAAGREPDARSWRAIEVKRAWLDGHATDADLAAARDAARDAAWDAARDAAWAAARDAAWDAAWAAALDAAWAAALDAQNTELERRLLALAPMTAARGGQE